MDQIVQTTAGAVRGQRSDGVVEFRSIPYAEAPVGELRWHAPRPHPSWEDVRVCDEWGPTPPQPETPLASMLPPQDEACLHVSVWTPGCDDVARPVMVWIHGGAFATMAAADPAWLGDRLAAFGDVVVVSVEYRTGTLGFLDLSSAFGEEFAGSGNLGLLDQVAALEWVRDNISGFGGDPGNVTIFGESAGGMSVGSLLGMPVADGLFHKAVAQSGAASMVASPEVAAKVTERFLFHAGVQAGDRAALFALSTDEVMAAQNATFLDYPSIARELGGDSDALGLPTRPVLDGIVFPRHPLEAIRDGSSADIPLLVGTTRDEFRLFTELLRIPVPKTEEKLADRLSRVMPAEQAAVAAKSYMANHGGEKGHLAGCAVATDMLFRIPAIRLAEAQSAHQAATWMYRFDWPAPFLDGKLGACHGIELLFVFDPLAGASPMTMLAGERPASLVEATQQAWVAFARSGDPTCEALSDWPAYEEGRRATMILDDPCRVADDPDRIERELWDGVF